MGNVLYRIEGAAGVREDIARMLVSERQVTHSTQRHPARQAGILQGLGMALQSADIAVRSEEHEVVSRDVQTIIEEVVSNERT